MSEKPLNGMKEQRERRKRINRIKTTIIATISIWMVVSMVLCTVLSICVFSLNKKMNSMLSYYGKLSGDSTNKNGNGKFKIGTAKVASLGELDQGTMDEYDTDRTNQYTTDSENQLYGNENQEVYLTFDDGPSDNTDAILDILAEHKVKATFFVTGKEDEHSKEMYKRIVAEGHTLALHSYSHKYSTIYKSLDAYKKDLTKLSDLLYNVTGVRPKYVRFPGGSSNQVSNIDMKEIIGYLNEEGYTYYDWNVVSGDATSRSYTTDDLVTNIMEGVKQYQTSIVLMHDATNKISTVNALEKVIDKLQNQKVKILPIDEKTKIIQHIKADSVND
ncbi:MAG: polysaccharide deacetylase family protein [Lachnospiraceae bacterium]